jgi:hypothetical protein
MIFFRFKSDLSPGFFYWIPLNKNPFWKELVPFLLHYNLETLRAKKKSEIILNNENFIRNIKRKKSLILTPLGLLFLFCTFHQQKKRLFLEDLPINISFYMYTCFFSFIPFLKLFFTSKFMNSLIA